MLNRPTVDGGTATRLRWTPDDHGVRNDYSKYAGDRQASDAYTVRYIAAPVTVRGWGDDQFRPVVDIHWYVVKPDGCHPDALVYVVEWFSEYVLCRDPNDPAGTEMWSGEHDSQTTDAWSA